jgi:TetR/AcrR family transcriptional regulator, repressor for uid operon
LRIANPAVAEARTKEIMDAALRCFVRTGFKAASMRDIAGEAGVSLGLLYRYFDNKAAIVAAVIEMDSSKFVEQLQSLMQDNFGPDRLLDFLVEEIETRGDVATFVLTSEIVNEATRDPAMKHMVQQNMLVADEALTEAFLVLSKNSARKDAAILAQHVLALVDALASRKALGLGADSREILMAALSRA